MDIDYYQSSVTSYPWPVTQWLPVACYQLPAFSPDAHPTLKKNIPAGVNKRLSHLSTDEALFDQAAPESTKRERLWINPPIWTDYDKQEKEQTKPRGPPV